MEPRHPFVIPGLPVPHVVCAGIRSVLIVISDLIRTLLHPYRRSGLDPESAPRENQMPDPRVKASRGKRVLHDWGR